MKKPKVINSTNQHWYRHTSEYSSLVTHGVFPCKVKKANGKPGGIINTPYETIRTGQFTFKGIPCHKINRSEKRGGVTVPIEELSRCPKRKPSEEKQYLRKYGGKAVTWGILPKKDRLRDDGRW